VALKWNEAFFRQTLKSPQARSLATGAAQEIAGDARASAPVDSGEYRDLIDVEVSETENRVVATVIARARHSMIVEARTGNLARSLMRNARG
jgi:hypothetical protein